MQKVSLISLRGLKLWFAWNLVTYIGLIISGIILNIIPLRTYSVLSGPEHNILEFITDTLGGFVIGLVIGWFQSLIIGFKINGKGKWILATAIGLALWGSIFSVSRMSVPFPYYQIDHRISSLAPFLIGPVIGIAQWLVLRQQVNKAGWWVVVSALGWFLPLALLRFLGIGNDYFFVAFILTVMIIPGVLTGTALLYSIEGMNIFGDLLYLITHNEATRRKSVFILFAAFAFLLFSAFTAKAEIDKAYAVCSKEMSTREGYGVWEYQKTGFLLPEVVFVFSDGCNDAECHARRNDTGWYVSDVWETLVNCLL